MTTVAVIQARRTSTRLPGKMLLPLAGVPVLQHIVERVRSITEIDHICITIPEGPAQAPLESFVSSLSGVQLSRGPEEDLLRRFANAARETEADVIIRLWGDCPAVDPVLIRSTLSMLEDRATGFAYLSSESGYPLGNESQAIRREALLAADGEADDPRDREFVQTYFQRDPERFGFVNVFRPGDENPRPSPLEVLLDTSADYNKLETIFHRLYPVSPLFGYVDIEALAEAEPALF